MTSEKTPKKNLKFFIEQWNQAQKLKTPALHIKIAEWLERSWQNGRTRLLLMAFRSSGKSTLVGLFSAWLLYCKAELRILVLAADYELAKKMVRNVKRIIEVHPLCEGMKPSKVDQWASDRFTVQREFELRDPSMLARGIGSNITGSRADIVICDDVEVPNTSDTREKRAGLRERLLEISYVLVPGGTELYVGTPHTYYTIYETEPKEEADNAFLEGYRLLKIPVYDEAGDSVWPERFSALNLQEIRDKTGPNKFASQMLLEPVNIAEGRLDPSLLNFYDEVLDYTPEIRTLFLGKRKLISASAWWDPAFGSAGGDNSVLACLFIDEAGNYYLQHVEYIDVGSCPSERSKEFRPMREKSFAGAQVDAAAIDEATAQCRAVMRIAKDFYLPSLTVETNGLGRFLPNMLRNVMVRARVPCAVNMFNNSRPKTLRILEAFDAVMAARMLYVHKSVARTPFMQEIREWRPEGYKGRDDGLDAVAGALMQEPIRMKREYGTGGGQSWMPGQGSFKAKSDFNV